MDNKIINKINMLEKVSFEIVKNQQNTNDLMHMLASSLGQIIVEEVGSQIKSEMILAKKEIANVVNEDIMQIKQDVDKFKYDGIDNKKSKALSDARNRRLCQLLGSPQSDKYIVLNQEYRYQLFRDYKALFDVKAFNDIINDQYDDALAFIKNWDISYVGLSYACKNLLRKYTNDELPIKVKNAYERFKGISETLKIKHMRG